MLFLGVVVIFIVFLGVLLGVVVFVVVRTVFVVTSSRIVSGGVAGARVGISVSVVGGVSSAIAIIAIVTVVTG